MRGVLLLSAFLCLTLTSFLCIRALSRMAPTTLIRREMEAVLSSMTR